MKILILFLIAFNIHSITSNVVCGSSRHSNVLNVNRADDVIDIQFSPFSPVDGIRFTAILQINVNDSYLQENVKSLDFELKYSDNGTENIQNCYYDIPASGVVSKTFPFERLNYFTNYAINVGYTLKSGDSFENKANTTFETCFGSPDAPTDLMISYLSDCVVSIQWKAPVVINSPKVCYYDINMRQFSSRHQRFILNETTFIQVMEPNINYTFYIQSVNNASCYISENPKCSASRPSGSQSSSISYTLPSDAVCSDTTTPVSSAFTSNFNTILQVFLFLTFILNQF